MHAHGGNVLEYQSLANHLAADQPVYALQARGLDGHIDRDITIEAMATAYRKRFEACNPKALIFSEDFVSAD